MGNETIYNKNGKTIVELSKFFLGVKEGSRIPTFTDFVTKLNVSRGTVQNSIEYLELNKHIVLESRGHLGTFLISKNVGKLLDSGLIVSIVGTMPLPYSRRYEGLATGIINSMENSYDIPVHMSYMRGSKKRVEMLLTGRYDFAVLSLYAAEQLKLNNNSIKIIKNFGAKSYSNSHVIVFADKRSNSIKPGMRVGIDIDSIDQEHITKLLCKGIDVKYVSLGYSQIIDKLQEGDIDAAVWNEDELRIEREKIHKVPVKLFEFEEDTTAVIVINSSRHELLFLIGEMLEAKNVLEIQKMVLQNKIIPNY